MISQTFEEVRKELRQWREDNIRNSEDVVDKWVDSLQYDKSRLADERWMVEEQVFISALDVNRLDIAEKCLNSLKMKFPESLRVAKLTAMKLEALERYDEALTIYDRIIREDETNSSARKRKVAILRGQRRYIEAIRELSDYLNKFMSDSEAWHELSDLYLKVGDYGKAAFCMEELILHQPFSSIYFTRYAEIKYTQGGYDNLEIAKAYFSHAVKQNPKGVRAMYGLKLTCEQIAAAPKLPTTKRKETQKLADYAQQLIKERYESQLGEEVAEAMERLNVDD